MGAFIVWLMAAFAVTLPLYAVDVIGKHLHRRRNRNEIRRYYAAKKGGF